MEHQIGCDTHQRYSVFVTMDEKGKAGMPVRVDHNGDKKDLEKFLRSFRRSSGGGGSEWRVVLVRRPLERSRLEAASGKTAGSEKTDARSDEDRQVGRAWFGHTAAGGSAAGGLDSTAKLRDLRGLPRTRLAMRRQASLIKNRIHAAIRRYGLRQDAYSDLFSGKARVQLSIYLASMPAHTRFATTQEWVMFDEIEERMDRLEVQIKESIGKVGWVRLLKPPPGVGEILGATIYLEIGDVTRFHSAAHVAAYARRQNAFRADVLTGQSLPKMAFTEAANCTVMYRDKYAKQHVGQLYERLKERKCHGKAAAAVARHLAESSWCILPKKQEYPHRMRLRCLRPITGKRGGLAFKAVLVIAKPGAKMLMLL